MPENASNHPSSIYERPSPDYAVTIDGEEQFVWHFPGLAGGAAAWISFDFEKPVTLTVTPMRKIDTASVSPVSAGIQSSLDDNTVTFAIDKPGHYFLKTNDAFQLPLYIFANERPSAPPPKEGDPNVRYYGPGIHQEDLIELQSDETLYLAPGALVYGGIKAKNARNIRVCGKGTLIGSNFPHGRTPERFSLIDFLDCQDVVLEGILVLDSFGWTAVTRNCDRVHMRDMKLLSERPWSTDGYNPCSSRDVLIESSFARCKDDCVSVKGLQWENGDAATWPEIRDITVRNCVFWSDNNNGVVIGSETRAKTIENIRFENCDFLYVSNTCGDVAGALSIICLDDTEVRNIDFENIRIEHSEAPPFNFHFTNEIFRIPGSRVAEGDVIRGSVMKNLRETGVIEGVRLKGVEIVGGPHRRSYINGIDEKRIVQDVSFENLRIHGQPVSSSEDCRLETNAFAQDIRFK